MALISVTVKLVGQARLYDTAIDGAMPLCELAALLAEQHGWAHSARRYAIEAYPPGALLPLDTTPLAAGVSDGTWLVFHPITRDDHATNADGWPVSGWHPIPEPPLHWNPGHALPAGDATFPWRRVDHDPM